MNGWVAHNHAVLVVEVILIEHWIAEEEILWRQLWIEQMDLVKIVLRLTSCW
jgi:hypothetical protein